MEKAFQYKDMVKTFPGFKLGPLNLELEPGTVLGLIGRNGAGKTTSIQCLVGLLRADSGEMRVFGRPNDLNKPEWKQNIGYVGDIHVFYERWTGQQNLRFLSQFYPNWSEGKAAELANRFQLPLDKRAKDLSTGNRVKLSLVSALAHSPKLLLLDEPTSGIDPVVRNEVLDVLFEVLET
jgi:ABC-2 type transport system ATP-binding protein